MRLEALSDLWGASVVLDHLLSASVDVVGFAGCWQRLGFVAVGATCVGEGGQGEAVG